MRSSFFVVLLVLVFGASQVHAEIVRENDNGFSVEHKLVLPVTPEEAYDAMTGDISGWWDHKFSENPARYFIEPRPGGGFLEIFDDSGDGVLHATVIYAHRGKVLRYKGPLGFSGKAVEFVISYEYQPLDNGCVVKLTVEAMGNIEEGWSTALNDVWHHFLFEQLKPYVEAGKHKS